MPLRSLTRLLDLTLIIAGILVIALWGMQIDPTITGRGF